MKSPMEHSGTCGVRETSVQACSLRMVDENASLTAAGILGWRSEAHFLSSPNGSTVAGLPTPVRRRSRASGSDRVTPRCQPPSGAPKLQGLGQRVKEGLPGSGDVLREIGSPRGIRLQEIQKPGPGLQRHSWPDPNQQSVGRILFDIGLIRRELVKPFGPEQPE